MEKLTPEDVQMIQTAGSQAQPTPVTQTAAPVTQTATTQQASTQQAPGATNQTQQNGNGQQTPPEEEDEIFDLNELGYQTFDELKAELKAKKELERQVAELNEYKAGPKFASPRQKTLYDFATRFEGMELSAARQLLDVVELDLNSAQPERIRFEAFRLQPENKILSQEEVVARFRSREAKLFGDPNDEGNPPTQDQIIEAKIATAQAKETLSKMKSDWENAMPAQKTPEQIAQEREQYLGFLQEELTGFEGIPSIKLLATDEKGEKLEGSLNFKIDPQEQLPVVMEALADPAGWWDSMLEELQIMKPGSEVPDFKKFAELVTAIKFREKIWNMAYQQGHADTIANKLKAARNVSDPSGGSSSGVPQQPVQGEKKEANREAMKVAGLI
jgi:hypothetical protein